MCSGFYGIECNDTKEVLNGSTQSSTVPAYDISFSPFLTESSEIVHIARKVYQAFVGKSTKAVLRSRCQFVQDFGTNREFETLFQILI